MKKQFLETFFWLDDRTGLRSTSKLIRMLTWMLGAVFVIFTMCISFASGIQPTQEDIQVLNLCKDFLIFFCGFAESSYQFNRNQKMKHGSASLVKTEEEEPEEEPKRQRFDL